MSDALVMDGKTTAPSDTGKTETKVADTTTNTADTTTDAGKTETKTADTADTTDTKTTDTATPPAYDWRKEIAGDDEKVLKELEKTADLKTLHKRLTDTQKELRDQGRVKIPGKEATPEELAAFSKALGVPPTVDKYDMKGILKAALAPFPGMQADDADKAFIQEQIGKLHAAGGEAASPKAITAMAQVYFDAKETAAATMLANEQSAVEKTERVLKGEWGAGYQANLQYANAGIAAHAGADKIKEILEWRSADGSLLGANPEFIKMMSSVGRAAAQDPNFLAVSQLGGTPQTWATRKAEIMALRNGTSAQQKQYASPEIQQELDTINVKLAGQKPA